MALYAPADSTFNLLGDSRRVNLRIQPPPIAVRRGWSGGRRPGGMNSKTVLARPKNPAKND